MDNAATNIVQIKAPVVFVRESPSIRNGTVCCKLMQGVYLECLEKRSINSISWIRVSVGWICSLDMDRNVCFENASILEAEESWKLEENRRERMASAIASSVVRSHPLQKAKRLVRSLLKHTDKYYPGNLVLKANKTEVENIMISLGGQMGLSKQQIFEYVKIAASQQSNPSQSVIDIVYKINHLINIRPSQWVVEDLNVLETDNVRRRNNKFVMAAAAGDLNTFRSLLESSRQELTSLHTELNYTALHAAAEFGQKGIVDYIITTGVSLNMRDPRRGQTGLHYAAYNGRADVIASLLAAGADRKISCNKGLKPYEVANKQGHTECCEMLKYLPPMPIDLQVAETTIDTISVSWRPPLLSKMHHSDIVGYFIDCYPVDYIINNKSNNNNSSNTTLLSPTSSSATATAKTSVVSLPTTNVSLDYIYEKKIQEGVTAGSTATCTFTNLLPSNMYSIRVKCQSLSGWSPFCLSVTPTTLQYVPDAPEPIEICKITPNGLLLSWHPPYRCNGLPVDFYQLELIDVNKHKQQQILADKASPMTTSSSVAQDALSPLSPPHHTQRQLRSNYNNNNNYNHSDKDKQQQQKSQATVASGQQAYAEAGGHSKWYRMVKHKNLNYLHKYLTGLEPSRAYQCRVRAHNELGFSPWSLWTGPVCPGPGVSITRYCPEQLSATLSWFVPILPSTARQKRHVVSYEIQLCCLRGPMTKSIVLLTSKDYVRISSSSSTSTAIDEENNSNSTIADINKNNAGGIAVSHKEGVQLLPEEIAAAKLEAAAALLPPPGAGDDETNEYITLRNDLTENSFEINGLKAGSRYKCQVRAKLGGLSTTNTSGNSRNSSTTSRNRLIRNLTSGGSNADDVASTAAAGGGKRGLQLLVQLRRQEEEEAQLAAAEVAASAASYEGEWNDWEYRSVSSDIFAMPATPPDPPFQVRAVRAAPAPQQQSYFYEEHHKDRELNITYSNAIAGVVEEEGDPNDEDNKHESDSAASDRFVDMKESATVSEAEGQMSQSFSSMNTVMPSLTSSLFARSLDIDIRCGLHYDTTNTSTTTAALRGNSYTEKELQVRDQLLSLEKEQGVLLITHDSIEITWDNGLANGYPVSGFLIQRAQVRTYRWKDVIHAREAYYQSNSSSSSFDENGGGSSSVGSTIVAKSEFSSMQPESTVITKPCLQLPKVNLNVDETIPPSQLNQQYQESNELVSDGGDNDVKISSCIDQTHVPLPLLNDAEDEVNILTNNVSSVDNRNMLQKQQHVDDDDDSWEWIDISSSSSDNNNNNNSFTSSNNNTSSSVDSSNNRLGYFTGSQSFRATGLDPGATYIFRVKQRNALGWSVFSRASRMIATYPSVPPGCPIVFAIHRTYAAVKWAESVQQQSGTIGSVSLTNLEYEVQLGIINTISSIEQKLYSSTATGHSNISRGNDHNWVTVEVRYLAEGEATLSNNNDGYNNKRVHTKEETVRNNDKKEKETPQIKYVHVMLDRLISSVTYILRVRVRAVVGWSPWSEISAPFRTLN